MLSTNAKGTMVVNQEREEIWGISYTETEKVGLQITFVKGHKGSVQFRDKYIWPKLHRSLSEQ